MRYEGNETIEFPSSISGEGIREAINVWLGSEKGKDYQIQKKDSGNIVLKKSWMPSDRQAAMVLGVLSSFGAIYVGRYVSFLDFPGSEIVLLLVGFIVATILYRFWPRHKVIIDIGIGQSKTELSLEATKKDVAESDFDSLINALENNLTDSQDQF